MRLDLSTAEAKALAALLAMAGNETLPLGLDVIQKGGLTSAETEDLRESLRLFLQAASLTFDPRTAWAHLFRYFEQQVRVVLQRTGVDCVADQAVLDAMSSAPERDLDYYACFRDGWKHDVAESELARREAKR